MKIIAGRNMLHSDSLNELVINETLAKAIGFKNPKDAVGKLLTSRPILLKKRIPSWVSLRIFTQVPFTKQ